MLAAPVENKRARPATRVRPEIQALRALAVLLVVIYHFWPKALPGGFIGVDVFFAISGFLITSHLMREVHRSGRVSLAAFWARRARRILPAALLVLLFCAIATIIWVPENYWQQFFGEIRASTAYVQNWHLAGNAVDYLAAQNDPSLVQHFWSLSAEEQFYLVWPVLILAVALLARAGSKVRRLAWIAAGLFTVTALSLAYSIYDTASNPAAAYFVTPTRAWEFGAGGLLALLPRLRGTWPALNAAVSWAGLTAILVTAFAYSVRTPFPGYQALLPVLGALAVMRAGAPTPAWAPTPLLKLAPVQFMGNISYSVYLWHWPLLILAPFALGRGRDLPIDLALLALTVLLAWLTKVLVEDPVRIGPLLAGRPARWTFAAVLAATAIVAGVTAGGDRYLNRQLRQEQRVSARILAHRPRCFGAASRDPAHPCTNAALRTTVVPTPIAARTQYNDPCTAVETDPLTVCAFGASAAAAKGTFAVLGDSHAGHWRNPLGVVARAHGWRGLTIKHSNCYYSGATKVQNEPQHSECARWKQAVLAWFPAHPEVSTVFVSYASGGGRVEAPAGESQPDAQVAGFIKGWADLPASVKHIIVLRDTPKVDEPTFGCVQRALAQHAPAGTLCSERRRSALSPDYEAVAAAHLHSPRVQVVDMTRYLCSSRRCYPVVGGALVLKDQTHLTPVFATTLGPFMLRQVDALMRSWK